MRKYDIIVDYLFNFTTCTYVSEVIKPRLFYCTVLETIKLQIEASLLLISVHNFGYKTVKIKF